MADDGGEQQELGDSTEIAPPKSRQARIIELYDGDSLREIAAGLWGKVIVEAAIVAAPIGVIILPVGFILAYLNIGPFTYVNILISWLTLSGTVFGIVWCFLASEEPSARVARQENEG